MRILITGMYGSIAEGAWTEQSPLDPNSPYSAPRGQLASRTATGAR
jgi:dTDP-D-glucose 4,6-dehydratase